jgi:hypothetical protein
MDNEIVEIKQLRFIDGSEVICEFLEEHEDEILIRFALKIERLEVSPTVAYHVLRPWMTHQTGPQNVISVNSYQILAIANPVDEVIDQYYKSLETDETQDQPVDDLDNFINEMSNFSEYGVSSDSAESNIISLSDRNKMN